MLQDDGILDDVIYSSNLMSQYCRVELPDFDCNSDGSNGCSQVPHSVRNVMALKKEESKAVQIGFASKEKLQSEELLSLKSESGDVPSKIEMTENNVKISEAAVEDYRSKSMEKDEQLQSCKHSLEDCANVLQTKEKKLQYYKDREIDYKRHLASKDVELRSLKEGFEKQLAVKIEELKISQREIQCYADKVDVLKNELQFFKDDKIDHDHKLITANKDLQHCKSALEISAGDLKLTNEKLESCRAVERDYINLLNLKDKELELCRVRCQELVGLYEHKSSELKNSEMTMEENSEKLKAKEDELLSCKKENKSLSDQLNLKERELPIVIDDHVAELKKELGACKLKAKNYARKLSMKEKDIQMYKLIASDYAKTLDRTEQDLEMHRLEAEDRSKYNHKSMDFEDSTSFAATRERELDKLKCKETETFPVKTEDWTEKLCCKDKQIELFKVKLDRCEEALKACEEELEDSKFKARVCAAKTMDTCKTMPEDCGYVETRESMNCNKEIQLKEKQMETSIPEATNCAGKLNVVDANGLEHKRNELEGEIEALGSVGDLMKNKELETFKEAVQNYSKKLELCNKDLESYKTAAEDYANELDSKDQQLLVQRNRVDNFIKTVEEKDKLLQTYKMTADENTKKLALVSEELQVCKKEMEKMHTHCHDLEDTRGDEVEPADKEELSYKSQMECYAEELDMKDKELRSYKFLIDRKLAEIKQDMESCSACYSELKQQLRDQQEKVVSGVPLNDGSSVGATEITGDKADISKLGCKGVNGCKKSELLTCSSNAFEADIVNIHTSNIALVRELKKIKIKLFELMSILKKLYISSGIHPANLKKTREIINQSFRVNGQTNEELLSNCPSGVKINSAESDDKFTKMQMQTMFVEAFKVTCDMEAQINNCCLINASCCNQLTEPEYQ